MAIKCGIEVVNQRLLHASKELQEVKDGREMKLRDYGITHNSTLMLVIRLQGGLSRLV